MIKKYLIIGSSAGGIGCALRLRMVMPDAEITILTAEDVYPYNKCLLADVLLGERESESIIFCSPHMLTEKKINLVMQARVTSLDTTHKEVLCADGRTFLYDRLCLAVGRSPYLLPVFAGQKFTNVFNFYYKKNLDQLIEYITIHRPRHAVVIGAGLTGLEAADGLRARGCAVTIVEAAHHVLPNLVNEQGAGVITAHIIQSGVQLITGERVIGYTVHNNTITSLKTATSGDISVDLVVCAIGAQPNTDFLPPMIKQAQGYCVVDDTMQTSVPDIYAVGDCCMVYDKLHAAVMPSTLWPDAMQQGMYAAYNMAGTEKIYSGTVQIAASGFFGLKVACAGPVVVDKTCRIEEVSGPGWYHRFVYQQEKLSGFMLIGNTGDLAEYRRQLMTF